MAKQQYRLTTESQWMGASGNAILALFNVPGSGKKIVVHDIEIYNKNQLGKQVTVDTSTNCPNIFKVAFVSSLTGGNLVPIVKHNSSATNFPSTIQVKTGAAFVPTYENWNGTTTYTDATVAINDTTFTPGSAPSWIASEHVNANRYLVVTSGNNIGTYKILGNDTSSCTLIEPPFYQAGSTTGIVANITSIINKSILKQGVPSISITPISSSGYFNNNHRTSPGTIWSKQESGDLQNITIRANEKLAVFVDQINYSAPMFVEATFIVDGSPNYTYKTSFYTYLTSEKEALLSFDNNSGSGLVLRLVNISVTEVGTLDTPYFQIVPFGSIDPASFSDSAKVLTATPTNSSYGSLSASIAKILTNVPVLPYGVPQSSIALGAPAAAVPRGFNYLNSKDFIGPVYRTYFPEAAANKFRSTTYFATFTPGTFGTHVSQALSKINNGPITIREGESIGIVSGAETATAATSVPISGFGAYEFSLTFTVENATTPSLTFTGLKDNTEVRIFDHTTGTELGGIEIATAGSTDNRSFSWEYEYSSGAAVDVMLVSLGYQIIRFDNLALTTTGSIIPIQQAVDRWYSNN
jgi:hypothetical protein